jgi:hypothetical protein
VEKIKTKRALSGYYQKANKGDISFMKRETFIVPCASRETMKLRKLRYRIKKKPISKAMIKH